MADVFIRDRVRGVTRRVSIGSDGRQGNGISFGQAISADARFIAFTSEATNLVPGDTNGVADVFIHDRVTHITERASVSWGGKQGDGSTHFNPTISTNGRFVVFESAATNLVPGDTNGALDVFVRDRAMGTTRRVSVSSGGKQGNSGSGGAGIAVSAGGRFVAFEFEATNLVPETPTARATCPSATPRNGHHSAGERWVRRPPRQWGHASVPRSPRMGASSLLHRRPTI